MPQPLCMHDVIVGATGRRMGLTRKAATNCSARPALSSAVAVEWFLLFAGKHPHLLRQVSASLSDGLFVFPSDFCASQQQDETCNSQAAFLLGLNMAGPRAALLTLSHLQPLPGDAASLSYHKLKQVAAPVYFQAWWRMSVPAGAPFHGWLAKHNEPS